MAEKRSIWIISEGSPGHVSQSVGLVQAIARLLPIETITLESRPRVGGLGRSILRTFVMGRSGLPLSAKLLHGAAGLEPVAADLAPPALIVSSGGKSVFAARTLAVRHQAPYVLIGERKPYPPDWFHTVLTPSSLERASCDVPMDLIPTKITPELVAQAASAWTEKPAGRLWAMLIGGHSRSHHFTDEDWQQLAAGMASVAKREGIRWLVTTSRRTGRETEDRLRQMMPADVLADAVWWCSQPEKKLAAYLGAAEAAWVTQDSVSMITEAVVSGKPVIVLRPQATPFPETSYLPGYLANLEAKRMITRIPIAGMASPLPDGWTSPTAIDPTSELATRLCQRLGWLAESPPSPLMRLILASASPRRRELLARLPYAFEVVPSAAEEIHDHDMPPAELCEANARIKALDIGGLHPEATIIGADTLVFLDGRALGKPRDLAEATAMLRTLSGRTHSVCTGVAIVRNGTRTCSFHETTEVTFHDLTEERISEYLSLVHVLDKAGAYGIQDRGDLLVREIRGSFDNVMGLPVERLRRELSMESGCP